MTSQQLSSNTTGKSKKASSQGQIDKLFQQQLREGSEIPTSHPEQLAAVEDISDEEFGEGSAGQLRQHERAALTTEVSSQQRNMNDNVAQDHRDPFVIAGNTIPCTSLCEDPIEDFSNEEKSNPQDQPTHGNLLTSPVKNKRNTDRTASIFFSWEPKASNIQVLFMPFA